MAMTSTDATKNDAVDGAVGDVTQMSLHNGDPGASGTANEWVDGAYSRQTVAYAAAASGAADITGTASFTGAASEGVTHIGLWAGATFKFHLDRTSGDAAANAAGEYDVTSAAVSVSDLP